MSKALEGAKVVYLDTISELAEDKKADLYAWFSTSVLEEPRYLCAITGANAQDIRLTIVMECTKEGQPLDTVPSDSVFISITSYDTIEVEDVFRLLGSEVEDVH